MLPITISIFNPFLILWDFQFQSYTVAVGFTISSYCIHLKEPFLIWILTCCFSIWCVHHWFLYFGNAILMILTEMYGHRAAVLPLQPNFVFPLKLKPGQYSTLLILKIPLFPSPEPSVASPSSYPSSVVFAFWSTCWHWQRCFYFN